MRCEKNGFLGRDRVFSIDFFVFLLSVSSGIFEVNVIETLSLIIVPLLVLPCSRTEHAEEVPVFDGKWDCFNGVSIVLKDNRYGLVDKEGSVILTPVYETVEFLDADIAFATLRDSCFLLDRTGRVFGAGKDKDSLKMCSLDLYSSLLMSDKESWDKVVRSYGELCRSCRSVRGKHLGTRQFAKLRLLVIKVKEDLDHTTGVPTKAQKVRLEELSEEYRKAF